MKKGSYTVEAALLMGILIPLLAGVIYMGFYLKARGEVYGNALEMALRAALTGEVREGTELEKEKISISLKKEIPSFPFGRQFFQLPNQVEAECTLERQKPSRTVFRLHSLKKVIRQVKDK